MKLSETEIPIELLQIIGSAPINVKLPVPQGTAPMDLIFELLSDGTVIEQTLTYILNKEHVGQTILFENVFTIRTGGEHTISIRAVVKNSWGDRVELSDSLSFELSASVIPIILSDPWVVYLDEKYIKSSYNVRRDFEVRGWNIIDTVGVGEGSYAADGWSDFMNKYATNPAICVLGMGQTPIYTEGPKFWGQYILEPNGRTPGKVGYVYKGDMWLNGTEGKVLSPDSVALLKYFMQNKRAVLLCWSGTRFDTGDKRPLINTWNWAAERRAAITYPWLFFDAVGIVDHGPEVV